MISLPSPGRLLFATALTCLLVANAAAQVDLDSVGPTVSAQFIEQQIAEIQNSGLETSVRDRAAELYRRTLADIESARVDREAAVQFAVQSKDAVARAEQIRQSTNAKIANAAPAASDVDANTTARAIELRYQQEEANEAAVKAKLADIEQRIEIEHQRPIESRKRLIAASEESRRIALERAESPIAGEAPVLDDARRWMLRARSEALRAEIAMLDQAMFTQPQRLELLEAQRYATATNLDRIQQRANLLKELLGARRRAETREIVASADIEAIAGASQIPGVDALQDANQESVEELFTLTTALEALDDRIELNQRRINDVESRRESLRLRLTPGTSGADVSRMLAEQRRVLPELNDYRSQSATHENDVAQARLRKFQIKRDLEGLGDARDYARKLLEGLPAETQSKWLIPVERFVAGRRKLLLQAQELNGEYLRALVKLEFEQGRLQDAVNEFEALVSQHLLWVRSKNALGPEDFAALPGEISRLLRPAHGADIIHTIVHAVTHSLLLMLTILFILLYTWKRAGLRAALRATGERLNNPIYDSMRATFKAIALSLLLAVPWPLLTAVTGYHMLVSPNAGAAAAALGAAILRLSPALFFLRTFRTLCLKDGVAEAHFNWPATALAYLRRQMDLLHVTFLLPALAAITSFRLLPEGAAGSFTQVLFVVATLGITMFAYRLAAPRRGVGPRLRPGRGEATARRWSRPIFAVVMIAPVTVGAIAAAGYLHSAGLLMVTLLNTVWLLLGVVLAHEMLIRWLLLAQRNLLRAAARKRWEMAVAARRSESAGEKQTEEFAEEPVDIASVDSDTRTLIRALLAIVAVVGSLGIWSDLLPAFASSDATALWYQIEVVDGVEQPVAVTPINLALSVVIGLMTWIAARTLPTVLEIVLRLRGGIAPGSRLALATLLRYGIATIGAIWALDMIGTSWSKLQWMVAALGVGIGFGLQEIIANFISGLIILIERPVRIGDVVTVGDATGKITRVQIRATTLRNWDQQELIVPNKEFVTGRVINWTLSDENIRINFEVGIAFGSDVTKALELLTEAIAEQSVILDDPEPLVTFERFGDNALILGVRCYIANLNKRLETTTALHLTIERKFREADIVIAFPQRDVHIDTAGPLEVRLNGTPGDRGTAAE